MTSGHTTIDCLVFVGFSGPRSKEPTYFAIPLLLFGNPRTVNQQLGSLLFSYSLLTTTLVRGPFFLFYLIIFYSFLFWLNLVFFFWQIYPLVRHGVFPLAFVLLSPCSLRSFPPCILFLLWLHDSFSFGLCVMVMKVRDCSDIKSDIARVDASKFNMVFPGFLSLCRSLWFMVKSRYSTYYLSGMQLLVMCPCFFSMSKKPRTVILDFIHSK